MDGNPKNKPLNLEDFAPELDRAICNPNIKWFDMYRFRLARDDYFAYLDYTERHEHGKYIDFVEVQGRKVMIILN